MFLGFDFYAWVTIVTLVTVFGILLFTKLPTDFVFMGAVSVLYFSGVFTVQEAFSGFSSPSVVLTAAMMVVVAGLKFTGVLQWITKHVFGVPKTYAGALVRMMLPVTAFSFFLNNTTITTLFMGIIRFWSKKLGISPSKFYLPLMYAALMGGACTIIGTSSNIVIAGLYYEETGKVMNIFTPLVPGLFCVVAGLLFVIAVRRWIPDRESSEDAFEHVSDYIAELLVPSDNPYIGKTIRDAGLYHVKGGTLIEIVRFDRIEDPSDPNAFILGGDRLIYSGQVDEILELKKTHGLVTANHHVFNKSEIDTSRRLRTAYITYGSQLIGTTFNDNGFEMQYGVTLIAVAHRGKLNSTTPRKYVLAAGDTLLFECPRRTLFNEKSLSSKIQFYYSDDVANYDSHTVISSVIMGVMIILSALNILPILQSAILAVLAMVVTRCCTISQAMDSIKYKTIISLAGSVVLGKAIQDTGIAERLVTAILGVCGHSPFIMMAAICLVAAFITQLISNAAAAAIFFPVMFHAANEVGHDPMPFLIALMIAANAACATPIGSPSNMLVYGPGGYRFADFLRTGIPLMMVILMAGLFAIYVLY